jgi:FtsH-binding integral membrane protein
MEARVKTNPNRFWAIVIVLGWAFDFLFWKKPLGINFAIFVTLCLLTGILLLRADGLRLSRTSGLLLLPLAFFAGMTFIRLEPMTVFLSISMAIFLMGVVALTYINGAWIRYTLLDYIFGYLRLFGSTVARPLGFVAENRRLASEQPAQTEKPGARIWPVLRGIVIALPIIAIFASLLSSADPIFANRFKDFIDLFKIDNLPEYIFRLAYILILAYLLAGIYLHAAQKSDEKVEEKTWVAPFLGFTESTIVLGSVVLLFIAFVFIQFQYFFGGQANISIEGYTYSEYARKGFGELVAVAFFSLLLLLGLGAITRRENENQQRIFSMLGVGLVGLVIVMLVAAFQRLGLYEAAYGFSRLRAYTHVFMIWLGLLLITVVILEARRRQRSAGLALVLAALGFVISLNALNVDAFIVNQNIQREIRSTTDKKFAQGRADLDAQYFVDLSEDAIPALVSAFRSEAVPVLVREKVGAALACKQYERKQDTRTYPWQSFHFSRLNADRGLGTVNKELDAYKIIDKDWPVQVKTPAGEKFPCYQYYD